MGEVWSARNERTTRDFAIKFLLPELARDPDALHRFVREAKATGSLRHPNVVAAMDAGMHESRPYLVMELLSGESLESRLKRDGRLEELEACILLGQVARALEHAHRKGLIHRDLSSANIFLCDSADEGPPVAKVLDFGVSKVLGEAPALRAQTGSGKVLGSPQFMSPEQAKGEDGVDGRSDVWSLGVLLYQALSGQLPFQGNNYNALLFAILHAPHEALSNRVPQLDAELVELVESCLVKDVEVRSQSVSEVAALLESIALRLSREQGRSRYVPRRRQADRIGSAPSNSSTRWVARRALPSQVLPWLTRSAQALHQIPSSAMLALGLMVGACAGVAAAKHFLPHEAASASTAPLPKSACEGEPEDPLSGPIPLGQAGPTTKAASAAANESDLVKAMARGLDVSNSRGKSAARPLPRGFKP